MSNKTSNPNPNVDYKELLFIVNKCIETKNKEKYKDVNTDNKVELLKCLDLDNKIQIIIPSIEPGINFKLETNNDLTNWEIPIIGLENHQLSLTKILPLFNITEIPQTETQTETETKTKTKSKSKSKKNNLDPVSPISLTKHINNLIDFLEIVKVYNYCFNCGAVLELSNNKFMACDKSDCINICNSYYFENDNMITNEFQKYKDTPNITILEFIIKTAYWAISSPRREIIYDPKPLYLENLASKMSNTNTTIWDLLDTFIKYFPLDKLLKIIKKCDNDSELFNRIGEIGYAFIKMTLKSNNTMIFSDNIINSSDIYNELKTTNANEDALDSVADKVISLTQFNVQHPQQIENVFKKAKETCYLYHGSRQENWYSIMRNGLKVGSTNKLLVNGAVYGNGIYLSDEINFSLTYSNSNNIVIGVCNVIGSREQWKKTNNIYVVPDEKNVLLKYLIVFPNKNNNQTDVLSYNLMKILNTKFQHSIQSEQTQKQSQVSSLHVKRLMKEYKTLIQKSEDELGFKIKLKTEDNLDVWKIYIKSDGFEGNPLIQSDMKKYNISYVELEFTFNENYPVQPPFVRIVSPRFIYRTGHITIGGSICMELLTNQGWDMTTSVSTVITYIKSAIMEGEGQIDPANYKSSYDMNEAVDAYQRMLKSHGWL
jgi:ubiquitin-protein ligase